MVAKRCLLAAVTSFVAVGGLRLGTYIHPELVHRSTYRWTFPAARCASLLFGDVNGDGRDDAVRTGCGGEWVVAVSDGFGRWVGAKTWWDGAPAGAARFLVDLNGDGAADAATATARGWALGYADHAGGFHPAVWVPVPCLGAQAVSRGVLWCVDGSLWTAYRTRDNTSTAHRLAGMPTSSIRWWVADVTNDTVADAVVLDAEGTVWVGEGTTTGFEPLRKGLLNFTAARGGWDPVVCAAERLVLAPSSPALAEWLQLRGGGSAGLICVHDGEWVLGGINLPSSTAAPLASWKIFHGGRNGGAPPPRPTGYVGGDNLIYVYQSYHLADPTGSGSPGPLACNLTAQYLEPGGCGVLPAASHVTTRFTTNAPAFSSSNVDLWDSWHLPYKALLRDGSYGKYDTLDMEQSGFMLERVSALGFSFFILDQSNGMPAADGYVPWENARGVAALIARMNKQRVATGRTGLGYTFELGCCTNHAWDSDEALPGMEAQLRTVWQAFMNSTDAETATIAGNSAGANAADLAAGFYRHPTSGKPLIVIYTIPMFESRWGVWMASRPESYGHRFHIGYSDNTRNGSYGWMMQRNCDPSTYPYDAKTGCLLNASFDAGHLVDNDTMWTAPSFGRVEPADAKYPQPYAAYAARDIRWYRAGFEAAAAMCPSQLVVGCINDYSENQGFWPSTCAACETGDETQPDLFWNATVVGTALVQRRCGLEA